MRIKKFKLLKKILSLTLVLFLCVESFAAVVADNDGSAFITKAEFDSLKNSFQAQIDQYNTSLDSKIDGAIAAYLAGIRVAQDPTNYFDVIKANLGEVRFLNSVKSTSSAITTQRNVNISRHAYQKRYTGISYVNTVYVDLGMPKPDGSYCYTWIIALARSGTESSFSDQNPASFICDINAGSWSTTTNNGFKNKTWNKMDMNKTWTVWGTQAPTATKNYFVTKNTTVSTDGSGTVYRYKVTPTGKKVILSYCSSYYPVCDVNVYGHTYKNYASDFKTNYATGSGTGGNILQYDNTTVSKTFASTDLNKWGKLGSGTAFPNNYTGTTTETRWNASNYLVTVTDNINYETRIWGKVPTSNIYCIQDTAGLTAGSQVTINASSSQSTLDAEDFRKASGLVSTEVTLSGIEVKLNPPVQSTQSLSLSSFCNDYVSTVVGEEVKHGQGIKIGETPQDGDLKVQLTFKNAGNENASCRFILTDGKVGAAGTRVLRDWESINCNGTTTVTRTVSFDKKSELWINCYSNTDGVDLILDNVKLTIE